MKKFLQISLVVLLVAACGTPLEQPLRNFNAYFNSYYNLQKLYEDGYDQNQRQLPDVNPEIPIKVFPSPTRAGQQEFELAIETGASILRNHSESKYVEPSIEIIGKSFFYRSEYFSALEKFQELQMLTTGELEQRAVFWKGRTLLEMQSYNEGIRFIEEELELTENWQSDLYAKTNVVLAQLYVAQENWTTAQRLLRENISDLPKRDKRDRAHFLHGQILERMGELHAARDAYGRVRSANQDYSLVYNAKRKEAEVSRQIGEYDYAYNLFNSMSRDDKFYEERIDLQYELARTVQLMGRPDEAMKMYNQILYNRFYTPTPLTRTKTFYGIAEIYRFDKDDFRMAAAYYDSSASINVNRDRLPSGFNARDLANSFGEYARYSTEIAEMDSLLYLGRLEPAEFDSVIAEIQRQRQEEIERELRERQRRQSQVVTTDNLPEETADEAQSAEYGFLNVRNPMRVTDASLQFQAIWGDRPLADNWRRRADVRGTRYEQLAEEQGEDVVVAEDGSVIATSQAAIDLSEIPFTKEQQDSLIIRMESRYYQLGNVFFLSLNMPDSAKVYYKRIAENNLSPDLIPRSLYSLTEIEMLDENFEEAYYWGEKLVSNYPNSVFAQRIAERLDLELEYESSEDELFVENLFWQYRGHYDEDPAEKAEKLRFLADNGAKEEQKPLILYEVALEYMKAANREHFDSDRTVENWFNTLEYWDTQKAEFRALQDSAQVMLADTTLSEQEHEYWQTYADSSFAEPDLREYFPFEGTYWDSTRVVLNEIETLYTSSSVIPKVRVLSQTLEPPVKEEEPEPEEEIAEEIIPEHEDGEIPRCTDVSPEPRIVGGLDSFMNTIVYPSWTENADMMGEVLYEIRISEDGSVLEYEQASRLDRSGLPEAFETAIRDHLQFEPDSIERELSCIIAFWFEF